MSLYNSNKGPLELHILSVGQCGADAPQIASLFRKNFNAQVDTADTLKEAVEKTKKNNYQLILVNRILDQTGEEGIELIEMLKAASISMKVMLVSNYEEAQDIAVSKGALRGFGKNALSNSKTVEIIKSAIDAKI